MKRYALAALLAWSALAHQRGTEPAFVAAEDWA